MPYDAADNRYESAHYRRCGKSGLHLPEVSLGLWYNFGGVDPLENMREMLRRSFDLGITHFDLANNYGPPPGSAETNFGQIFAEDFKPYRDEQVIPVRLATTCGLGLMENGALASTWWQAATRASNGWDSTM